MLWIRDSRFDQNKVFSNPKEGEKGQVFVINQVPWPTMHWQVHGNLELLTTACLPFSECQVFVQ